MNISNMKVSDIRPYEKNPRLNEGAVDENRSPPSKTEKIRAKIYKGRYLVTEDGQIFSMGIKGGLNVHLQKTRPNNHGYLRASINRKDEYVHRVVAKCFIPNPNGYKEINHLDGIKTNNDVSNLEWCSRSKNNRHAFQTGLRKYDELKKIARLPKSSLRRLADNQIKCIRSMLAEGLSDTEIASRVNCCRATIWQIRTNKIYKEIKNHDECCI